MKKSNHLLFLFVFIFASITCLSQENNQSPLLASSGLNENAKTLNGKKFLVKKWIKNGKPVKFNPTDFASFGNNGNYESVLLNIYSKGSWSYDASAKKLFITTNGNYSYEITELTPTTLKVKTPTEEWELELDQSIKPNSPVRDTYKNFTGRYKIMEHKNGLLKIQYKPNDFIELHADGSYEQVLLGIYRRGTWELNDAGNAITVKNNGTFLWTVVENKGDDLRLSKNKETLWLSKNK